MRAHSCRLPGGIAKPRSPHSDQGLSTLLALDPFFSQLPTNHLVPILAALPPSHSRWLLTPHPQVHNLCEPLPSVSAWPTCPLSPSLSTHPNLNFSYVTTMPHISRLATPTNMGCFVFYYSATKFSNLRFHTQNPDGAPVPYPIRVNTPFRRAKMEIKKFALLRPVLPQSSASHVGHHASSTRTPSQICSAPSRSTLFQVRSFPSRHPSDHHLHSHTCFARAHDLKKMQPRTSRRAISAKLLRIERYTPNSLPHAAHRAHHHVRRHPCHNRTSRPYTHAQPDNTVSAQHAPHVHGGLRICQHSANLVWVRWHMLPHAT